MIPFQTTFIIAKMEIEINFVIALHRKGKEGIIKWVPAHLHKELNKLHNISVEKIYRQSSMSMSFSFCNLLIDTRSIREILTQQ